MDIVDILNKLFEYSNCYIEVRNDVNLPMPGFSYIEKDIHGRILPVIILNLLLIPNDSNVLAHIISHEWGHHILRHIEYTSTPNVMKQENFAIKQQKENEADKYAANFIKKYSYNKEPIIAFFREHPYQLENRIAILNSI